MSKPEPIIGHELQINLAELPPMGLHSLYVKLHPWVNEEINSLTMTLRDIRAANPDYPNNEVYRHMAMWLRGFQSLKADLAQASSLSLQYAKNERKVKAPPLPELAIDE
jgi:hypothetical protein